MDNTFFIKVGQIVKSKAGRDSGKVFIIKDILDQDYVAIVDGKLRKLAKPKKKKIKHLMIYKDIINIENADINDSYIRNKLKDYS
ncbi:hypothetical protein [Peptoniphilus obesi]|uniref:hypothetical protein n=1 Tax=Peptoniphilus obesi TaxID=1472765 RepID=UPI0004AD5B8B|nr:hypothetical protein [Peptoniphilus obesi]